MLLSVSRVSLSFGDDILFSDVSFDIDAGEKAAIVGPNGCGKSTLLKVIVGEQSASGNVVTERGASVGYLAQDHSFSDSKTIHEYVLDARPDVLEAEAGLDQLTAKMSKAEGDDVVSLTNEYHTLRHRYELMGGDSYRSEVIGVLKGLGFKEVEFDTPITSLSGGQKTRASLARLLITKPDLLILDEPINHLDLSSIEWLESYLINYKNAVLIVAHDRYFLDRITGKIIDLSEKTAHVYKGNYTAYAAQKELRMITAMREYEKQQAKIAHEEAVIKKLQSFNREKSIKRAESRKKLLAKMEVMDRPVSDNETVHFVFDPVITSGNDVLFVKELSKSYKDKKLFETIDFELHRGEHVALIGDNGTGKTTILKILNGLVKADGGKYEFGTNVTIAYYDQEQQLFDENKTLFDEMHDAYPKSTETQIRNVLAAFLFKGDDVFKKISFLSGGERGRIALCKLMLSGANLLILDEPTNHLDMPSKDILEEALNSYDGTVLYVSHDRYFVNRTADRILELSASGLTEYLGDYDYYVQKKAEFNAASETSSVQDEQVKTGGNADWQEQKRIAAERRKLENAISASEKRIEELEQKIADIDNRYNDPQIAKNSAKLNELSAEQSRLSKELDMEMANWEKLSCDLLEVN